ncbi:putative peptidyl-tRNA hydrolase 2 [Glandiceps talaboti]
MSEEKDVEPEQLRPPGARESIEGEEERGEADGWKADESLVQLLCNMGITRNVAERALFFTGNSSAELATSWIFENPESADIDIPVDDFVAVAEPSRSSNMAYKMVFVVNCELEMGAGKAAAQVAHAAVGMYRFLLHNQARFGESLFNWEENGAAKIVVRGESTQHLLDLQSKVKSLGLPNYLVSDAGRTQIPEGSITVLGIMGKSQTVDTVTGELKLL